MFILYYLFYTYLFTDYFIFHLYIYLFPYLFYIYIYLFYNSCLFLFIYLFFAPYINSGTHITSVLHSTNSVLLYSCHF
jgi:hypothetical protein